MAKIVDVILRLKDQMSGPMSSATAKLQANARTYQKMGRQIQKTGQKLSAVGATLTKTITAPAVALGAVAVKSFGEYDKQMRLVQQTMGATADESNMLSDAIKKAAKDSVYGMQDAADAALNYARAGFNAKQTADMIAPSFELASGTGTDLAETTAGMAAAMKVFSANSEEAARYADIFAKGQAQAKIETKDLFDAVSRAGSMFTTFKWDISDLTTAVGVLGDAGVNGAVAGNALKSGMASMTKSRDLLAKLGVQLTNTDGTYKSFIDIQKQLHDTFTALNDVEQTELATKIYGKNQMGKWLNIIKASPEHILAMEEALGKAAGTSKTMSDALMSGPGGAIEKLKSNWDIFKNTLGETIAPIITPLLEKLTDLMQKFSELTDEQKKNIVKWVGIAAAMGPVLSLVGKLTTGFGTLVSLIGKAKGAGGIFAALKGSGLAVSGVVGGIVAGVALIIKNWDKLKGNILGCWNSVKGIFEKIAGMVKGFAKLLESSGIEGAFVKIFDTAFGVIGKVLTALDNVLSKVGNVADKLTSKIGGALGKVAHKIAELSGVETTAEQDTENFWTGFTAMFDVAGDFIGSAVERIGNAIGTLIDAIGNGLSAVSDVAEHLGNALSMAFSNPQEAIRELMMAVGDMFNGLHEGAVFAVNFLVDIVNVLRDLANAVTGWIPYIFGGEYNWIPEVPKIATSVEGTAAPSSFAVKGNAQGTRDWRGGLTRIAERGGEIVDLPKGSRIYPHDESVKMAYKEGAKSSGNTTVNIPKLADQIVVRQDADIDMIATKLAHKLEKTSLNLGSSKMGYQY